MVNLYKSALKRISFLFFFLYWGTLPAQVIQLSQENPHLLAKADGSPFFYLGDTAWELFHSLNRGEADYYLQDRASKGFNVIQAVVLAELEGLSKPNAYGEVPLLQKDIQKPNEKYFEHVDYIIDKASDLGIYVGLLPCWGEYVTPRFTEQFFKSPEEGYEYGFFLGNRYKNRTNIIWILGGDRLPDEAPNGISIWRAMAEGIADGLQGERAFDGEADFSRSTMSYHSFPSSSQWFHQDPWLTFHMWGSYHMKRNESIAYEQALEDYNLSNPKPSINSEPAYEDHPVNWQPEEGWFTDFDVRQIAYWSVFAGTAGHTYGAHAVWQFYEEGKEPASPTRIGWREAMDFPGSFQMIHLKNLLLSRPYFERVPDQSIINGEAEAGREHIQATRGENYAFVYIPQGKPVNIDLGKVSGSILNAYWFNPIDGTSELIGSIKNKGRETFTPPKGQEQDWVLVIDDAEKQYPEPGKVLVK